jgi:hypothetical protein
LDTINPLNSVSTTPAVRSPVRRSCQFGDLAAIEIMSDLATELVASAGRTTRRHTGPQRRDSSERQADDVIVGARQHSTG